MDLKYQKFKKNNFIAWLFGGNAYIYFIILAVTAFFAIQLVVQINKHEENAADTEATSAEDKSDSYVDAKDQYIIKINKKENFLLIQKKNGDNYEDYKAFTCSVSSDVKNADYKITGKQIWFPFTKSGGYGHYASLLNDGFAISSVPYYTQDLNSLDTDAYKKLGKSASKGYINLMASNARWIYENISAGVKVIVYEEEGQRAGLKIEEPKALLDGKTSDPSDISASDSSQNSDKINYMSGVSNVEIKTNSDFDVWEGVYACDYAGRDITSQIKISGDLDLTQAGTYTLIYHLSDRYGTNLDYYRYILVKDDDEEKTNEENASSQSQTDSQKESTEPASKNTSQETSKASTSKASSISTKASTKQGG